MTLFQVRTQLGEKEALRRARRFFGRKSLGLSLETEKACCLEFSGGGGHVSITALDDEATRLEIETRAWEPLVRQFMRDIA